MIIQPRCSDCIREREWVKRRIENYKFTPYPLSGNPYPQCGTINANKEWLKDESNAFIDFKIAQDTAADLYPNNQTELQYLEYIQAEVAAWVAVQVAGNISICRLYKTCGRYKN